MYNMFSTPLACCSIGCYCLRQSLRICARILRLHYYRRRRHLGVLCHRLGSYEQSPQQYGNNRDYNCENRAIDKKMRQLH
jgi:hypothetical protein